MRNGDNYMTEQVFFWEEVFSSYEEKWNNEYSQHEKFVPVSATWRNTESFTDYLLNKVQTKKD